MSASHPSGEITTIDNEEHRSVNGVNAKAVTLYGFDGTNLVPVKTDSSGNLLALSSDGTTTASVVSGDTGQNAQLIAGSRLKVDFTTTTVQSLVSTDVSNYTWVSVHQITQGTGSTITFQSSDDNVNWLSMPLINGTSTVAAAQTTSASANQMCHGPLQGRYFRLNITGISAGTTSGTVVFSTMPRVMQSMGVSAAQSGTWTMQPGNTPNTVSWLTKSVSSTAALTNVASSATTVSLLAANTARRNVIIFNESTAILYLKFGATASTTSYTTQVASQGVYIMSEPVYTGAIDGIWASANGTARITEVS